MQGNELHELPEVRIQVQHIVEQPRGVPRTFLLQRSKHRQLRRVQVRTRLSLLIRIRA